MRGWRRGGVQGTTKGVQSFENVESFDMFPYKYKTYENIGKTRLPFLDQNMKEGMSVFAPKSKRGGYFFSAENAESPILQ